MPGLRGRPKNNEGRVKSLCFEGFEPGLGTKANELIGPSRRPGRSLGECSTTALGKRGWPHSQTVLVVYRVRAAKSAVCYCAHTVWWVARPDRVFHRFHCVSCYCLAALCVLAAAWLYFVVLAEVVRCVRTLHLGVVHTVLRTHHVYSVCLFRCFVLFLCFLRMLAGAQATKASQFSHEDK